jgi:hypothetical protein
LRVEYHQDAMLLQDAKISCEEDEIVDSDRNKIIRKEKTGMLTLYR